MSKKILEGELQPGDTVLVDADPEKGIQFETKGKKRKTKE